MKRMLNGMIGFFLAGCFGSVFAAEATLQTMPISKVTTASQQSRMTPRQALQQLKAGNDRFLKGNLKQRDFLAQAKAASYGQYPWAIVLNCMDSRSVPELFFDQGLADLFTLRVAGNVLDDVLTGSMEFATKVVGARLIVVLGHTSCGAMSGACDGVSLGHLDSVLSKITPLVGKTKQETGLSQCTDPQLVNAIAKNNALNVARQIQEQSPIIRELIEKGQVGIVAGIHDIRTGEVTFFEEGKLIPQ